MSQASYSHFIASYSTRSPCFARLENYALAAQLRDQLSSRTMDDQMAILACNFEFYAAFTAGDYERMQGVWAPDPSSVT